VRIQGVLTSVLFTALRAYYKGVLAPKMHILNMPFEAHFVEVLVTIGTTLSGSSLFITTPRGSCWGTPITTHVILRRGWSRW